MTNHLCRIEICGNMEEGNKQDKIKGRDKKYVFCGTDRDNHLYGTMSGIERLIYKIRNGRKEVKSLG